MKKYKLIKEYPNSQPKGTVFVAENEINTVFRKKGGDVIIYLGAIEKFSEYFEEVKEPSYLITAFKEKGVNGMILKRDIQLRDIYYINDGFSTFMSKNLLLTDDSFEIYSVKNSKGIEFTIGDIVQYKEVISKRDSDTLITKANAFKIDSFFLTNDDMLIARSSNDSHAICEDVNTIHKAKTPIYTTNDGINIYEGDIKTLYILSLDLTKPNINVIGFEWGFGLIEAEGAKKHLCFISEENRSKYIKENSKKPIFTSADGVDLFEGDSYYVPQINHKNKLLGNYVEVKAHDYCKAGATKFSTKELAQEYIDNNQLKYSLQDIISSYDAPHNFTGDIKTIPVLSKLIINLKKLGK